MKFSHKTSAIVWAMRDQMDIYLGIPGEVIHDDWDILFSFPWL